jgi:hypothetical protein
MAISFFQKWTVLFLSAVGLTTFAMQPPPPLTRSASRALDCNNIFPQAAQLNLELPSYVGTLDTSLIKTGWEYIRPLYPILTGKNNTVWVYYQERYLEERYTDIQNFIYALPLKTKSLSEVTIRLSTALHELEKRQREEAQDLVLAGKRPFKNKRMWEYEKTAIEARQLLTAQAIVMLQKLGSTLIQQNMVFFRERYSGSFEQWREETKKYLLPELTAFLQSRLVIQKGFNSNLAAQIFVLEMKQDPGLKNFTAEVEAEMNHAITLSNLNSIKP